MGGVLPLAEQHEKEVVPVPPRKQVSIAYPQCWDVTLYKVINYSNVITDKNKKLSINFTFFLKHTFTP